MEGIFLVRARQWDLHAVYLRSQGFGLGNHGAQQKVSVWERYRRCDLGFRCCSA